MRNYTSGSFISIKESFMHREVIIFWFLYILMKYIKCVLTFAFCFVNFMIVFENATCIGPTSDLSLISRVNIVHYSK